ncbi:Diadenosine tetraphosphate (Ap4A) hydrolase [Acinetobacter marinus]|uniref:Diadenosine tetraphosphate (Ap4A) hydrolase n=1 Tax=Acinetobacter marinus TaxID=281375 RepID=A0A1G6LQS2_9GAMM|nr:HIT family protein [Acinetobacter marinus]SDC45622.1 Diadenosine tetraphosphate (Ap4A) hydrolase [Acinetobacter marinus]
MNIVQDCPFCQDLDANLIYQNDFGRIVYDDNPVSKGHCLIIPHQHLTSFFDASEEDRKEFMVLLELARNEVKMVYQPDGFHIGFSDGEISQQRIDHLHIHLIPRYAHQPLILDDRWGMKVDRAMIA